MRVTELWMIQNFEIEFDDFLVCLLNHPQKYGQSTHFIMVFNTTENLL